MTQTTIDHAHGHTCGAVGAVDSLVRTFASTKSRRTALIKVVGATLVGLATRRENTEAKKGHKKRPKKPKKPKYEPCGGCP
jgi:hypothetical protein